MVIVMRAAAAVVMVALLTLMIGPFQGIEAAALIWDKAAHFIAFAIILWSLGVLFRRLPRLWVAVLTITLGAAVEIIQGMVGRDASWWDLLADALGIATALCVWVTWRGFRPRAALRSNLRKSTIQSSSGLD